MFGIGPAKDSDVQPQMMATKKGESFVNCVLRKDGTKVVREFQSFNDIPVNPYIHMCVSIMMRTA